MEHGKIKSALALPQAELFVSDEWHSVGVVDVSTRQLSIISPPDVKVSVGDALAARMDGSPSAVVFVRSVIGDRVALEFRKELHQSLVDYFEAKRAALTQDAIANGDLTIDP